MTHAFFPDVSPYQVFPASRWLDLVAAGAPWVGAGVKVSEGRYGYPEWLATHWPAIRAAAGDRYGVDFFRLGYHFWRRDITAAGQAHVFLTEIERAGGLGRGDILAVDVERCAPNERATASEIEGSVSVLVDTLKREVGAQVVLYGGQWLAELGVRDRMGCSWLWYPAYVAALDRHAYERIGWDVDSLLAWQCAGFDGHRMQLAWDGCPATTPIGPADISVLTLPGGVERLRGSLWAEDPGQC
jgi:GH25 family lysozyme M1 (1,4-beta-N-acetylmuramidase)